MFRVVIKRPDESDKHVRVDKKSFDVLVWAREYKSSHPSHKLFIVNVSHPKPPPLGFYPDRAKQLYWCPYCAHIRQFKRRWRKYTERKVLGCIICGASAELFFIQKYNQLFKSDGLVKEKELRRRLRKDKE